MTTQLNPNLLDRCANDPKGPVAVHIAVELVPVEGEGAPFFPATFAMDEKYNIDTLSDGTKVALVDSVGSQANRMEPLFREEGYADLVPQINIAYGDVAKGTAGQQSILEVGHRLGDALIRCTELAGPAHEAFAAAKRGDAEPLARLAPTTLVFGAWDSRDTGHRTPRLVQSVIRAWDVSRLRRSAQYVPAINYQELGLVDDDDKLEKNKTKKNALAERGFIHVPSTGNHGGIVAKGPIRRDVTVNLVALRRLKGAQNEETMRRYLLGLALLAATEPLDPFLRQGCLLVPKTESPAQWMLVERDGTRTPITIDREQLLKWAHEQAKAWKIDDDRELHFDAKLAKADMKKKGAK
ncbi:MAG TPA: type I-U CRISPR-associated protein Cas7 [Nannocystis exedens]|nr:type I-U CRISPR-associated protein Cas7 [Nannocystis exedens]